MDTYCNISLKIFPKALFFSVLLFVFNIQIVLAGPASHNDVWGAAGNFVDNPVEYTPLGAFLLNLSSFFSYRVVPFLLGLAFIVFVWGMVQYFVMGGANDDAKAKGKSLMMYAIAAFVLIVIFFGVVNLLTDSTGLDKDNSIGSELKHAPKGINF